MFYNLHPNGEMDQYFLHGGCDVESGTKWSANFWIWNQPVSFSKRSLMPQVWSKGHSGEDLLLPPVASTRPTRNEL